MTLPTESRTCGPQDQPPRLDGPSSSPNLAGPGRGTVESWRNPGLPLSREGSVSGHVTAATLSGRAPYPPLAAGQTSSDFGDHDVPAGLGQKSRARLGHPPSRFTIRTWPQALATA
jgi:hypothetical protein